MKKVFVWYKVIIKIALEVGMSSPEVRKGIYMVEGYFQM